MSGISEGQCEGIRGASLSHCFVNFVKIFGSGCCVLRSTLLDCVASEGLLKPNFIHMPQNMMNLLSASKPLKLRYPIKRACRTRWYCRPQAMIGHSADFEVYGRVQGVFFRACTVEKANTLGVVGWVMNTHYGTVKGVIQSARRDALDVMKVC